MPQGRARQSLPLIVKPPAPRPDFSLFIITRDDIMPASRMGAGLKREGEYRALDKMTLICHNKGIMKNRKYTIEQLGRLTGFSRRTIRYYVQEGIIDPPAGRGRGGFYYDSHLAILLKVKSLQETGLKLAAIRDLLSTDKGMGWPATGAGPGREALARYRLGPGVDLLVEESAEAMDREKIQAIVRMARSILLEGD